MINSGHNLNSPFSLETFTPGPIQKVDFQDHGFSIDVLRLDLIRSWATGNKYYKLKYALTKAIGNPKPVIVSKGGPFSNHLYALSEACFGFGLNLVCIIRAYQPNAHNPTITQMKLWGAEIEFLDPDRFDQFDEFQAAQLYPHAYFIPEGGLSGEGLKGVKELAEEINKLPFDHIVIAGGSMCTACGLLSSGESKKTLHIVPAWKGCTNQYIDQILDQHKLHPRMPWDIWPDFHFGGFGKWNDTLLGFMTQFTRQTNIPLDPVYTGKMMYAIQDKVASGALQKNDKILAIHSGGLQGIKGYAYRFPEKWTYYQSLVEENSK